MGYLMPEKCILCGKNEIENFDPASLVDFVNEQAWNCPRCKTVRISATAHLTIDQLSDEEKWLLSAYFREKSSNNVPVELIHEKNLTKTIEKMQRAKPQGLVDAQHRFINLLGSKSDLLGSWVKYDYNSDLDLLLYDKEIKYIIKTLYEQELIEYRSEQDLQFEEKNLSLISSSFTEFSQLIQFNRTIYLRLTTEGRKRYEELISQGYNSNKVFVAMWYSDETVKLRESLKAGIIATGYDPIIADEGDYTGNIMDFVIGSVRQSKFVIADFTTLPEDFAKNEGKKSIRVKGGVRGGVYYEAGFAKGLGLEVIHTCKDNEESRQRIHFDIEHDNTIFWTDSDLVKTDVRNFKQRANNSAAMNLAEKIHDRIVRIFGYGPIQPDIEI